MATNLILQLQDIDCQIIRFDRPEACFLEITCRQQIEDVRGDVRDKNNWERLLKGVDVIFHFAAQTSIYFADQNPQEDFEINVMPLLHLLEVCRIKRQCPIIIFSGTVTEGGMPGHLPVDETFPDLPITFYDLHKGIAETRILRLRFLKNINTEEKPHFLC